EIKLRSIIAPDEKFVARRFGRNNPAGHSSTVILARSQSGSIVGIDQPAGKLADVPQQVGCVSLILWIIQERLHGRGPNIVEGFEFEPAANARKRRKAQLRIRGAGNPGGIDDIL